MSVSLVQKGLSASRFIRAIAIAKGDMLGAAAFAEGQRYSWSTTPDVHYGLKAAVDAMSTTGNAGALTAPRSIFGDFMEFVRPRSLLDRIPGFRGATMNTSTLLFTGDAAAYVTGQGQPKPLAAFDLTRVVLTPRKVTAMIVVTDETLRNSDGQAELSLGRELGRALGGALDRAAFDPDRADSIAHGATTINSTGSTLAAIDADLKGLIAVFDTGDSALETAVFVMSARTATYLSMLRGSGGNLAFPNINLRTGGNVAGIPVYISGGLAATGSPGEASVVLLDPAQVLVADQEQVQIDIAKHASIQMLSDPATGANATVSLWQANCACIRAERFFSVQRATDTAVVVLDNVQY